MNSMEISPTELHEKRTSKQTFLLLDVRRDEEHAFVALEGSLLIPLHELPSRVNELEPFRKTEIVTYCHHGVRSLHAAMFLKENGFSAVSMAGGIDLYAVEVNPHLPRY